MIARPDLPKEAMEDPLKPPAAPVGDNSRTAERRSS